MQGFEVAEGGGIALISHLISDLLHIPCNVLMGANLAHEIADGKFSETTIGNFYKPKIDSITDERNNIDKALSILSKGAHDKAQGAILHKLIQTEDFRVVV